ncbi:MFS general substrate transporter [Linderina pennispora]|uniref:MFS general substrate transporter n=1 Tax=Linderina pennispora TaxID=61395 RepID=A0A1Y1VSH4_9FUNG|nr:MFS general substrate transporter [Linderina pennispora]ORX63975.1 MFS general substrate transporter [Linderina pennispora]
MLNDKPTQAEQAVHTEAEQHSCEQYVESDAATLDPPPNEGATDPAKEFPAHTRYAVVASCFMMQALACGTIHAWGIQQEYLAAHNFAGNESKIKTLSYIGTLMYFSQYLWGMLAGWMADVWSYRKVCFIGVVFLAIGPLVASFCNQPWQYCLTQGILFGLGAGLVFNPTSTAPARWFTTRRGLATGITVAGVGVGGLVIAPLTEFLVQNVGVPWSQRIAAIYLFVLGSISCYFVRVPFQDKTRTLNNFDWSAFRDRRFAVHALMVSFVTAAYLVPYTYLPQFWTSKGISSKTASVLIAIANVSSAVGRLAMGFLRTALVLAISTVAALLIWPFATSIGAGLVMGIFYGFAAGGYWTLLPLAAAKLFGVDKLASYTGIFYSLSAVSAWLGNPVAGAILANPGHGTNYIGMIVYIGVLWAVALVFATINRRSYSHRIFVKE